MTITIFSPPPATELDDALSGALQKLFAPLLTAGDPAAQQTLKGYLSALSAQLAQGHVCLTLDSPPPASLQNIIATLDPHNCAPPPFPLILDHQQRLYFRRQYAQEYTLATRINALLKRPLQTHTNRLNTHSALFKRCNPTQQKAVKQSLQTNLLCISGGPGTGKTTTVAAILEALQTSARPHSPIALTAPTGKAAARLFEALQACVQYSPTLADYIPTSASTLHRLLGIRPDGSCRHHAANPLTAEIIIVDEASMLDLALASRLLAATQAHARLILLGDPDQLAAVEAGSVFSLLSQNLPADNALRLTHSHRFSDQQAIGQLAQALRNGDAQNGWQIVQSAPAHTLSWHEINSNAKLPEDLRQTLLAAYAPYRQAILQWQPNETPAAIFSAFSQFQILAAHYEGACGIHALNAQLAHALFNPQPNQLWYPGRAILITANDSQSALFNGDTGICLTTADGNLRVFFATTENTWRSLSPAMLPAHEDALAISVHKAQGSEYQHVACILPAPQSPLLCREWLYTALTRARERLSLIGEQNAFHHACLTPTKRISGLAERLRECAEQTQ